MLPAIVWKDLRHAGRVLRNAPGFTATATLILALAIGANTAMFSIVNAWWLHPLHFRNAAQLVIVLRNNLSHPEQPPFFAFYRDYLDWKGRVHSFQGVGGMFWRTFTLTGSGEAESFTGLIVTSDLLRTLGSSAERGRVFEPEDANGPPVIVISDQFWTRRFGRARNILGRVLTLNGKDYAIIGVMPRSFSLRMENQPFDPDVLALIQPGEPQYDSASLGPLAVIGRLKPGISMSAAEAELATLQKHLDASHPDIPQHMGVFLTRLQDDNMRFVRTSLLTLAGAVVFVLLIACANVAGLLLGRASVRRRELAVRSALGSSRGRLVSQLLVESLALAMMGGVLGLLIAYAGVRGFVAMNPFDLLPPDPITIDGRALAFAFALILATTAMFGAAPALKASRVDLGDYLRTRGAAYARGWRSGRGALIVLQVALSLLLMTGTMLMAETFWRLHSQPLGFQTDHVTVAQLTLPGRGYGGQSLRLNQFYDRLLRRVTALPGVQSAAIGNVRPLAGGPAVNVTMQGENEAAESDVPNFHEQIVTPDYFKTLAIPLLQGRGFTDRDTPESIPVVIVSDVAAQAIFKSSNPVGRRIRMRKDEPWRTVVGVAGAVRTIFYNTLSAKASADVFVPVRQAGRPVFNPVGQHVFLFVRAAAPLGIAEMRREVDGVDANVPVSDVMPLSRMVAQATSQPRMRISLLGAFAILALALAAIGIYGSIAQSTVQRTGEIGIRMALGARPAHVLTMVIRQALLIAAAGIAAGIAGALALSRVLSGFLYGAAATDAATYAAVAVTVLAAALVASYAPARRASRVDPMTALRHE
jgi:putative ABC transport system permease protein